MANHVEAYEVEAECLSYGLIGLYQLCTIPTGFVELKHLIFFFDICPTDVLCILLFHTQFLHRRQTIINSCLPECTVAIKII